MTDLDVSGMRILVSGSSSGLGSGVARYLLKKGAIVGLNGTREKPDDLIFTENCSYFRGDLRDPCVASSLVADFKAQFGRLDGLVCCAGSGRSAKPGAEKSADFYQSFEINFFTAINLIEAARNELAESGGSIVCISSICGIEAVSGAPVPYSCAKSALNTYVNLASKYLALEGVRINAVAPGNMMLPGSSWDQKLRENPEAIQNMLDLEVPLRKFGSSNDLAPVVALLISRHSSFTTGAVWTLDGGQTRSI